jgi:hypothetical protein
MTLLASFLCLTRSCGLPRPVNADWRWVPALVRARCPADLARIDGPQSECTAHHRQASRVDELASERIDVASGSRSAVHWSEDLPMLGVTMQEVLDRSATPTHCRRVCACHHLVMPCGTAIPTRCAPDIHIVQADPPITRTMSVARRPAASRPSRLGLRVPILSGRHHVEDRREFGALALL